jgi:hypothetical protein
MESSIRRDCNPTNLVFSGLSFKLDALGIPPTPYCHHRVHIGTKTDIDHPGFQDRVVGMVWHRPGICCRVQGGVRLTDVGRPPAKESCLRIRRGMVSRCVRALAS